MKILAPNVNLKYSFDLMQLFFLFVRFWLAKDKILISGICFYLHFSLKLTFEFGKVTMNTTENF